jgi:hypothetical protein
MTRFSFIDAQAAGTGQRAARVVTVIQQQPSWIIRAALTVAFLMVTAILLVVVIPAMLLAVVVFTILVLLRRVWVFARTGLGFDRSGRRNVRVVARHDSI